jgi:mono/diheme cytochrome c family protein
MKILIAAFVCAIMSAASASAQEAPNADIARGEQSYNAMGCWQCHGYEGQGGAGPRVGPPPLPWPVFEEYVRAPTGTMPPYSERVLSRDDLANIHAYLGSLAPPNPITRSLGANIAPNPR